MLSYPKKGIWYYRFNRESGLVDEDEKTWHSFGLGRREDGESFARKMLGAHTDFPLSVNSPRFFSFGASAVAFAAFWKWLAVMLEGTCESRGIGVVNIMTGEAVIREKLDRDPAEYVRNVKGGKRDCGIFSIDDMNASWTRDRPFRRGAVIGYSYWPSDALNANVLSTSVFVFDQDKGLDLAEGMGGGRYASYESRDGA